MWHLPSCPRFTPPFLHVCSITDKSSFVQIHFLCSGCRKGTTPEITFKEDPSKNIFNYVMLFCKMYELDVHQRRKYCEVTFILLVTS